jgi:hypothetical protein
MQKYRKKLGLFQFNSEKTEVVEAMIWQKHGDHVAVVPSAAQQRKPKSVEPFDVMCRRCYNDVANHGLLIAHRRKYCVCPGDYIVKAPGRAIERQAADKFAERYDPA